MTNPGPVRPPERRGSPVLPVLAGAVLLANVLVLLMPSARRERGPVPVPPGGTKVAAEAAPAPLQEAREAWTADFEVVNAGAPGEAIDVSVHAVRGKTTVVDFSSRHCPPCREMERTLRYLASRRRGLAIRQVDIDRPYSQGIDFDSPLAVRYGIHAIPELHVYEADGALAASGAAARARVRAWYDEEKLAERAAAHPEFSAPYRKR